MHPVGIEKRGQFWGVYFGLPGSADRKAVRESLNLPSTQEERRRIEAKNGLLDQIQLERTQLNWAALHVRFPNNEKIRNLLGGGGLKMDHLFDALVNNWRDKKCRSLDDLLCKLAEVREFFKDKYACDVDGAELERFVAYLRKRGVGEATINRKMAQVKRAFNLALEKKRIKDVPAFPDRLAEPEPRAIRFEQHEVGLVAEQLPEHLKRLPRVAGSTGWRIGELLSRKKSDVRLDKGVLYLDALHSKNGDERYFPLIAPLKAALEEQLEYVRKLELEHGMVIPWLFPNADPRHPIGERMYRFDKALETACEAAGLNVDPDTGERRVHPETGEPLKRGFHDFRRTAQDLLEDLGLSDSDIMLLVGHKTLSMRIRYKGRFGEDRARKAGDRLAAAISATAAAPSNVVSFVQPVYKTGTDGHQAGGGTPEKVQQNGVVTGWAGSESNTRHKDFQS